MASTYTPNSGIEKIGTGEQSGAWGTTTNTNFDIIDRVLSGVGTITLSGTTHTLTTSDGSASEGHYKVLILSGSPSGTNTITISPNDQGKMYLVNNTTGQTAIFTQGSGGNATVSSGSSAWIYADGAGAGAQVYKMPILSDLVNDTTPQLGGNLDLNSNNITGTGNITNTGNVTTTGVVAVTGSADVDNININGNTVSSTDTNGDVNISPNGTGTVVINTDLDVDNLNLNGNTVSSTDTNGNITIDPNGTGNVLLGNFTFDADQSVGSGQDDYVLTYNNSAGSISLEALPAAATIVAPTIQTFTSSGTWNRPTNCTKVKVTVIGGGASGASVTTSHTHASGGGGGAGGTAIEYIDVSSTSSATVTVGAGGSSVGASNAGNAGGSSSFGSFCSATGGSGGATSVASGTSGAGGAGGIGSNGDVNISGGPGGNDGGGGSSSLGGGAAPKSIGNGNAGRTTGGGGGGSVNTTSTGSNRTSGAGAAGIVIVEEYYS